MTDDEIIARARNDYCETGGGAYANPFPHNSVQFNAYEGGLHGVGVSCVNGLSKWLHLTVRRDGEAHFMEFKQGIPPLDAGTETGRQTVVFTTAACRSAAASTRTTEAECESLRAGQRAQRPA